MKPLNRIPVRFPGKKDCHPKKYDDKNWWENIAIKGNGRLKQEVDNDIKEGITEYLNKDKNDI